MIAHAGVCRAAGVTFIPLVVESLGGWSEEAIQTIKSIGQLQGQRLGIPPTLNNAQSVPATSSLWKGYASLWVRRQLACSVTVDGIVLLYCSSLLFHFNVYILFYYYCGMLPVQTHLIIMCPMPQGKQELLQLWQRRGSA